MDEIDAALVRLAAGFCRLKGIHAVAGAGDEILFEEWDWEVGVGLYGAVRDAQDRQDTAALAAVARWYDRQIGRGLPARQINSTAPMLALACLAEHADRPDWTALCGDWAHWLVTELPRTGEDGFEHVVKEGRRPGQLWDDTLFMAVLFLAQTGRMTGRADWVSEAQYQYLVHLRHLADTATGLFFHGWCFEGRHNYARALWARGNAWVTIAIPELFLLAPPADPALSRHLAEVLRSQVTALAGCQRADGMFPTLLDDPDAPVEASATAGIGYGVLCGIRTGLLAPDHATIAERACDAILQRIGVDGILADVSDGTPMGDTLAFYRQIGNVAAPYGQALASLFLMEMRRFRHD
ncbi:beta-galactosidase BglB [Pseudoponticoccus marisrubri]|uniref:Glycosyl hydrolase n=1 Tax=Pseudoponticoccus marisrubri TaxID=1685382 RepID=A0A0W7WFQ7_9RHOB|nr:glycoside hydrolase family 88 protein [Pseudoponticoccus marisrubri]KUF09359.1 glycosyl hydrolase [Pseudoponticoccus marisrubri]